MRSARVSVEAGVVAVAGVAVEVRAADAELKEEVMDGFVEGAAVWIMRIPWINVRYE
jgi:hypothetical protein